LKEGTVKFWRIATFLLVGLAAPVVVVALQTGQPQQKSGQQGSAPQAMPPLPKPGPEHALFKEDEGTWDAVVEIFATPEAPPMKSKGVETNTVGCGGLCLITDFKGEMMPGMAFHGHGTSTWDPAKKKYVGSWTDSMSQRIAVSEGTWDPAARTITGYMEGPDMSGAVTRMKSVVEYKGGSRVFTMYDASGGKPTMRITYTKRK
jgi:hypothetical protein